MGLWELLANNFYDCIGFLYTTVTGINLQFSFPLCLTLNKRWLHLVCNILFQQILFSQCENHVHGKHLKNKEHPFGTSAKWNCFFLKYKKSMFNHSFFLWPLKNFFFRLSQKDHPMNINECKHMKQKLICIIILYWFTVHLPISL